MAIDTTYRELLIDDFIKEKLTRGKVVSAVNVGQELRKLVNRLNLAVPQFKSKLFRVNHNEPSSALKFQETLRMIRQDLKVLYSETLNLTKTTTQISSRWRVESQMLEKQLIDLEERIENLLILAQDSEGYHSVIVDNFTDTLLVDTALTTADVDLVSESVRIDSSGSAISERILLNNLKPEDVTFKIRTTQFLSQTQGVNSGLLNPFHQQNKSWWTTIKATKQQPITTELTIKLTNEDSIPVSRIFLDLIDSSESSSMSITPLLSLDNSVYRQIPSNTFTQSVRTSANFQFIEQNVKYIKFILTKEGPDTSGSQSNLSYEFGFDEISFYRESFSQDSGNILYSLPLSVTGTNGLPVEFERLTLETCERIENNTDIQYSITTSDNAAVPVSASTVWSLISPINRSNQSYPVVLTLGDTVEKTIGIDEVVTVSYDSSVQVEDEINPDRSFQLTSLSPGTDTLISDAETSSVNRYSFLNTNDRILNHQIQSTVFGSNDPIQFNDNSLLVFRNLGEKGLVKDIVTDEVRGIQRGWRFEDPYYITVIEISNPNGFSMDVGDSAMIVDDISYTNRIDNTVLTGKSGLAGDLRRQSGIHHIKVHKNNWRHVVTNHNTLSALKTADKLYPFNQKLLVEGYQYGTSYPTTSEKIYLGADLFAGRVLRRVSPFDFFNNVGNDNYGVFAIDTDAPNTYTVNTNNSPTKVFLVKVDESNPDFQNERFVIRFNLINKQDTYLRLKAELITTDGKISPSLESYKIKLG